MTDSSDTSAIDEKKTKNITSTNGSSLQIGKFLIYVVISILIIIIHFSLGGLVLYCCKLGQSNIIPTETNCYPYSDNKPDIQPIQINIFNTFSDPQLSKKISFSYDKFNSSNYIIDLFRKYKQTANSNFLANYFISIIESLIQTNYSCLSYLFNSLNNLPEILIILFGPIILLFSFTFILIFNNLQLIYLWFAQMGWFFKQNNNDSGNGKPLWEDVTFIEAIDYMFAIGLVILFFILFWIFLLPTLPVLPFITLSLCVLSCITFKSQMNEKSITAINIIQEVFKYYKVSFMTITSLFVMLWSFKFLGIISGIFSIIILALIYFGVITIDIFKPNMEDNLSPLTSYEQALKKCNFKTASKEKHGLLYDLLFGQSGGQLTKQLKNLRKQYLQNN
jgi:hypothetical protein